MSPAEPVREAMPDSARLDRRATRDLGNEQQALVFCSNANLRAAIRNNAVTFPSQMVRLRNCADGGRSERIVQLYFVSGWPVRRICERYALNRTKVDGILNEWRRRAIAAGFVQEIRPRSRAGTPESTNIPAVRSAGTH